VEIVDAPALPAGEGAPQANSSHQAEIDNDDDDDDVVVVDPPLPAPTPTHNQQQYTEDENRPGQLHVEGGENDRFVDAVSLGCSSACWHIHRLASRLSELEVWLGLGLHVVCLYVSSEPLLLRVRLAVSIERACSIDTHR